MDTIEIKNRILSVLNTDDMSEIQSFGLEIDKILRTNDFQTQVQFFDDLDLPLESRIKFMRNTLVVL